MALPWEPEPKPHELASVLFRKFVGGIVQKCNDRAPRAFKRVREMLLRSVYEGGLTSLAHSTRSVRHLKCPPGKLAEKDDDRWPFVVLVNMWGGDGVFVDLQ